MTIPAKSQRSEQATEFVISRTFDAPRALVWQAWTDPGALAQWWGPKGCAIRVVKHEMREGGMFHYAMSYQTGRDMWGRFVYREIVPPERLVFVNSFSDPEGGIARPPYPQLGESWPLEILNRITLTEQDGKTKLTLRGAPLNASEEGLKAYARMHTSMQQGFGGTFEQLDAYLAKRRGETSTTAKAGNTGAKSDDMQREVTLERVFSAPVEMVWQAWTDAAQVAQWWGPECFTNPVCNWDARPGGKILVHMRAPDGTVHPMTGTFREVERPRRLAFLAVVEDSEGTRLLESLTTVTFEAQDGKTKLTVHAKAVGIAPIAAQMLAGMDQGWSETLDKLARSVSPPRAASKTAKA